MAETYLIWLAAAGVLALIEALTLGLTSIWFAGGAVAAGVAAFFGASLPAQILLFLLVSLALVLVTRPIAQKKLRIGREKTNVESIPGKTAIALEDFPRYGKGQVSLEGQVWSAAAADGSQHIQKGEPVRVVEVSGVTLKVVKEKKDAAPTEES